MTSSRDEGSCADLMRRIGQYGNDYKSQGKEGKGTRCSNAGNKNEISSSTYGIEDRIIIKSNAKSNEINLSTHPIPSPQFPQSRAIHISIQLLSSLSTANPSKVLLLLSIEKFHHTSSAPLHSPPMLQTHSALRSCPFAF